MKETSNSNFMVVKNQTFGPNTFWLFDIPLDLCFLTRKFVKTSPV